MELLVDCCTNSTAFLLRSCHYGWGYNIVLEFAFHTLILLVWEFKLWCWQLIRCIGIINLIKLKAQNYTHCLTTLHCLPTLYDTHCTVYLHWTTCIARHILHYLHCTTYTALSALHYAYLYCTLHMHIKTVQYYSTGSTSANTINLSEKLNFV